MKCRPDRRGGGVAIYVKDSNASRQLNISVPNELECIWVEVKPHRLPRGVSALIFCSVYITTKSPLQPMLAEHIINTTDQLRSRYTDLGFCITGDFNRMDIRPLTSGNDLKQIVTFHTRGRATLDLVLTNLQPRYKAPKPYSPIGKSDHCCVLWNPKSKIRSNTIRTKVTRPFPDDKVKAFGRWIQGQSWNEVYDCSGTQNKTNSMYSVLNKGIDMFFPIKRVKTHSTDKPWITHKIKSLITKRQKAFAADSKSKWRKLRNKCKREIDKAKISFYANRTRKLQATDPRRWYQSIKLMLNDTKSELNMHVPGIDRGDHKALANAINSKFVGVSSHIEPLNSYALPAFLPAKDPVPLLQPWHVYNELKKVKVSKSCGPDGIPPKLIKEFAYELSTPLTDVLNASFQEGFVPHQWRSAIVVPVPKQYPPRLDKLRPISLTDIFAKIAEGFAAEWIVNDSEANIDVHQFGNVSGVSTAHYLINLVHTLFLGAEKPGNIGTVVLTDFSKAFDLVTHNIAIEKLLALGVREALVPWICSFLSNRRQCVRYNQTLSDYASLNAGVPQGTKIGPITFQAVINDAAVSCCSHYWKYVDDLIIAENRHCISDSNLQSDLNVFLKWANSNSLKLNPDKCQAINVCFMRNPPPRIDLKIGSTTLNYVSHAKILGIHIQDDLKWNLQVIEMCKSSNRRLFMLRNLKKFGLNKSELTIIYSGYIRPLLEYCDTIWHSSLTTYQSSMIERIQKRACRIILGSMYISYNNALIACKLEPLTARRERHCLKFAKSLNKSTRTSKLLPPCRKEVHERNLRNDNELTTLRIRTQRFANSPVPYLTKLLNSTL